MSKEWLPKACCPCRICILDYFRIWYHYHHPHPNDTGSQCFHWNLSVQGPSLLQDRTDVNPFGINPQTWEILSKLTCLGGGTTQPPPLPGFPTQCVVANVQLRVDSLHPMEYNLFLNNSTRGQ